MKDTDNSEKEAGGGNRDVRHIYVVTDSDGKPHRAYHDQEKAERLLSHWQESDMDLDGRVDPVDLVEFNRGALND